MKKIMFNDRYGLTEAVLSGRKTKTRRLIKLSDVEDYTADIAYAGKTWEAIEKSIIARHAKYKVGEVVAVAQSYKDACVKDVPSPIESIFYEAHHLKGWNNKMFVRADLMPHQIRITNVRFERLQDISDADCIAEGVELNDRQFEYNGQKFYCVRGLGHWRGIGCDNFKTPREAYAALIDSISGKGTWESNPWVFVYDFELVK